MFNFNELAIVQPNEPNCYRGSFVGIRQDKYLGKMAFTVPKGFENLKSIMRMSRICFSLCIEHLTNS